ncbi:MAG: hypothetical protein ABUS57_10835 [Pseudomonadota bacterium]
MSQMGRRHFTIDEVQNALSRGKAVECLIGRCERQGVGGIRYGYLRYGAERFGSGRFELRIFESVDHGIFWDEAAPLNPELDLGDADETHSFDTLADALGYMEDRWNGISQRLVNEFMLPHEYDDLFREHMSRG